MINERSGRLYIQTPSPFWRAIAGCIAIGSGPRRAIGLLFSTAQTNGHAVTLRDLKKGLI